MSAGELRPVVDRGTARGPVARRAPDSVPSDPPQKLRLSKSFQKIWI
jgi:hypothetical protein